MHVGMLQQLQHMQMVKPFVLCCASVWCMSVSIVLMF